jgi:ABC-type Mn2+/Zn2+ transport system permease subunit
MNRSTLLTFVFAIVAIVVGLASAREAQYFYNSVSGEVICVCFVVFYLFCCLCLREYIPDLIS